MPASPTRKILCAIFFAGHKSKQAIKAKEMFFAAASWLQF